MKCPSCTHSEDRVLESRPGQENEVTRRRRECLHCGYRFTTFERIEDQPIKILKKSGGEELFDRQKIYSGIVRACKKRPVSLDQIEETVDEIEHSIRALGKLKIQSNEIGTFILKKLHSLDQVAYIRFASVYRKYDDVKEFIKEVNDILVETGRRN